MCADIGSLGRGIYFLVLSFNHFSFLCSFSCLCFSLLPGCFPPDPGAYNAAAKDPYGYRNS
jgi:hypothetical protein